MITVMKVYNYNDAITFGDIPKKSRKTEKILNEDKNKNL